MAQRWMKMGMHCLKWSNGFGDLRSGTAKISGFTSPVQGCGIFCWTGLIQVEAFALTKKWTRKNKLLEHSKPLPWRDGWKQAYERKEKWPKIRFVGFAAGHCLGMAALGATMGSLSRAGLPSTGISVQISVLRIHIAFLNAPCSTLKKGCVVWHAKIASRDVKGGRSAQTLFPCQIK